MHHLPAAVDTFYCVIPDIAGGSTLAQICVDKDTLLTDFCVMKSDKQLNSALSDSIR